jgi:hypothetical protein
MLAHDEEQRQNRFVFGGIGQHARLPLVNPELGDPDGAFHIGAEIAASIPPATQEGGGPRRACRPPSGRPASCSAVDWKGDSAAVEKVDGGRIVQNQRVEPKIILVGCEGVDRRRSDCHAGYQQGVEISGLRDLHGTDASCSWRIGDRL